MFNKCDVNNYKTNQKSIKIVCPISKLHIITYNNFDKTSWLVADDVEVYNMHNQIGK